MIHFNCFRMAVAAMAMAGAVLVSGCNKGIRKDIEDLKGRVSALEDVTRTLSQQLQEGALIKSVTPLPGNDGWKVEFANGDSRTDTFEIYHGKNGVTPKIEVRTSHNGNVTIWYNVTNGYPDKGWINTGVDLAGATGSPGLVGPTGPQGPAGAAGADAFVEFRVAANPADGNKSYIWYTTVRPAGRTETDWKPLLVAGGGGAVASVIDNDNGSVTFVMNDGDSTPYTFEKYSGAHHFEVIRNRPIPFGVEVTFRVNPSDAFIPTGDYNEAALAKWKLDLVDAGATRSYVTPAPAFELYSILPENAVGKKGQYVATIAYTNLFAYGTDYILTLVLDNGTNGGEVLVSSGTFTVTLPDVMIPAGEIAAAITDDTFRNYINGLGLDSDGDGFLSTAERNAVTTIIVSGTAARPGTITSLEGIEYFPWLTRLECNYNRITSLDLSKNTALAYLRCQGNQLSSLDVSMLPGLLTLNCLDNPMTTIDVSKNTALGTLQFNNMPQLTELDLSRHVEMRDMICSGCELTELDLSNSPHLWSLNCTGNKIERLVIPNNPKMIYLTVWGNKLTELDLSNMPVLGSLRCQDNLLTGLDISANPNLTNFFCNDNPGDGNGWFVVKSKYEYDSITQQSGILPSIFGNTPWEYPAGSGNVVNIRYLDVVNTAPPAP